MDNDLNPSVVKILLAELLLLALLLSGWFILDGGGEIIVLSWFWLFLTGIINFVLLLLLIMYRPQLWFVFIVPLVLLPLLPSAVSLLWLDALFENLFKSLSK